MQASEPPQVEAPVIVVTAATAAPRKPPRSCRPASKIDDAVRQSAHEAVARSLATEAS